MRSVWVAARRRWRRPSVAPNQPARLLHRPSSFHAPVRLSRELRRAARCAVWVGLRGAAAPCASRLLQVVAAVACISAGRLELLQLQCASNAPRKRGVAASAVQLAGSGIRGCDRQCKYSQRAGSGSGSQQMRHRLSGPCGACCQFAATQFKRQLAAIGSIVSPTGTSSGGRQHLTPCPAGCRMRGSRLLGRLASAWPSPGQEGFVGIRGLSQPGDWHTLAGDAVAK
jgi:hypothetical protein